MNKWEKELAHLELKGEKRVLEEMRENYKVALGRVNERIAKLSERDDLSAIRQRRYQEALAEQIGGIIDDLGSSAKKTLEGYLKSCYEEGFVGTLYDLQKQGIPLAFPIDQAKMARAVTMTADGVKLSSRIYRNVSKLKRQVVGEITRGFADGSSATQIAQHMVTGTTLEGDIKRNVKGCTDQAFRRAMTIARTEKGRVMADAGLEAMWKAKQAGADVVKQWDSTMDSRTRKDHKELDGQIREIDEPFEVHGHKAMAPHRFGRPEEDINCRCKCVQRARASLETEETSTKWDGENQCFVDLSDAKSYQDFKQRYDRLARGASSGGDIEWENPRVSALKDAEEVKHYLLDEHEIEASEGFLKLPLEKQKAATAGIDAAVGRFGKGDVQRLKLIVGSSKDEGQFDSFTNAVLLNKKGKSAYIVAYHEMIHAIDADKSAKMLAFPKTTGLKAYNMHSEKVLKEARRLLGLKVNQREYKDMLFEMFDCNVERFNKYSDKPSEIVAYALDREERGKSNALSKALVERF